MISIKDGNLDFQYMASMTTDDGNLSLNEGTVVPEGIGA